MNSSEQPNQQPGTPHRPRKLCLIIIIAMLIYGSVFLTLSFCGLSLKQVIFVSQIFNAAAFFLALAAFLKAHDCR
jgi:hypothetical protein